MKGGEVIRWQAPEYYHTDKSVDWYWAVGLIGVGITVISFIFSDVLFGIFMIAAIAVLLLYAARPAEPVECELNERGVRVGKLLYPWKTLESFWVEELPHHPKILLRPKHHLQTMLIVPLGDKNIDEVRIALEERLEEVRVHEPLTLRLMEYFGF